MSYVLGESTPFSEHSIVDLLKADLQSVEQIEDVTIPIPGWERTGLAIRYRLPEKAKDLGILSQKVLRETKDNFDRNLLISIDTMLKMNVGLYVKPASVEDYVELDPEETGMPVTLSDKDRLTGIFGWGESEVPTARSVVNKLFPNEIAIIAHAEKLERWMRDTKADLEDGFWQTGEG